VSWVFLFGCVFLLVMLSGGHTGNSTQAQLQQKPWHSKTEQGHAGRQGETLQLESGQVP
jgi:hypothetical protein